MNEITPPASDSRDGRGVRVHDAAGVAQRMRRHAAARGFTLDAAQERALRHFERLHEDLIGLGRLESPFIRLVARKRLVPGLYLWGGVGRGKSFLMDGFFDCAPLARKRRTHFHRFMQEIHHSLQARQGEVDPMLLVARDIARKTRLLCLDEFHITDITDAMLMRRLLEGLSEQGVVLVTTSNFHPDELYLHGLQRKQFLPAIELIKRNLEVVNVDNGTDYRLRELEKAGVYHTGDDAERHMAEVYRGLARHESADTYDLEIEGRTIRVRRHARGVAWFDFRELCDGPRGKADYIELAYRYHTVLLSGVPRFTPDDADRLRRFVWLVDEFYDRRVKLVIAAAAPAPDLIDVAPSGDSFQAKLDASLQERLTSRLIEMQTREYLGEPHLP
ncbi:MAG: cell division protein ZapE [Burkholderiales bacterium]